MDNEILPTLKKIVGSLTEGKNLITALKKQHISLIETEDEISQQLAVLINNRNMKLKSTKEVYYWKIILISIELCTSCNSVSSKNEGD